MLVTLVRKLFWSKPVLCSMFRTPHLAKEKMYKTSGHLPYYAESMFPKMEMDEHRADRKQIEERIAELKKQLAEHAKKASEGKSGA